MIPELPLHVEQVSLPERNARVEPELVCRTCTHRDNHLWHVSKVETIRRMAAGETRAEIACSPDTALQTLRVLETINTRGRIVKVDQPSKVRTRAIMDTCGYAQDAKCKSCDRFAPTQVAIPYAKSGAKVHWSNQSREGRTSVVPIASDGSDVSWWNVTVGGHCTIGTEGLVKDGQTVFCDPIPRRLNIENPSCDNCQWLDYVGEQWQTDYLTVNDHAALTPWEREEARKLISDDVNFAMAQGIALKHKQTSPFGRAYWYRATLEKEGWHRGQYKYKVRFDESDVLATITESDWRWTLHRTDNPKIVAVEVRMPHHKIFNLGDHLTKKPWYWPKPAKATWSLPDSSHLVNAACASLPKDPANPGNSIYCDALRGIPCYYHAKGPERSDVTGEVTFTNPEGIKPEWVYPPHGVLRVVRRNDEIVAVDGNDNLPVTYSATVANAGTMRLWITKLRAEARKEFGEEGVAAINKQYNDLKTMLHRTVRWIQVRPNWYANGGTEPSKPRCTHPAGLNLRKVFQDSFGSERTDWDFDHGSLNSMEVEEELRVGYRQHQLTPQRLHEEMLATDQSHPNYDPASGTVPSSEWTWVAPPKLKVLEGIGGMTDDFGRPVTDVAQFMDRLDEEVVVGTSGEAMRTMTKRMQMFGYDMSRGYYGKRSGSDKTSVPSRDRDLVIFGDSEADDVDVITDWRCVECERVYPQSEIKDYFYPVCEDDGADLYRLHLAREVPNPRSGGGVGNVYVMDSASMRQRKRLQATLCPNWRMRGANHISLEDTAGPSKMLNKSLREMAQVEEDAVQVIKIKQLSLSEDHKAHNAAYWAENELVIAKRTEYLMNYPETTAEEILRRFPRPKGIIYQPTSAGSLAKMGSV